MGESYSKIEKRDTVNTAFPLSFGQKQLWLIDQLLQGSPQYNLVNAISIRGQLDKNHFEKSLNMVIQKHAILRTVFISESEEVKQVILEHFTVPIEYINVSEMDNQQKQKQLTAIIDNESTRIFDFSRGPLLKPILLQYKEDEHIFILNIHHIISDEWSLQLMLKEIMHAYTWISNPSAVTAFSNSLPIQYADFANWQRNYYTQDLIEKDIEYWKNTLDKLPLLTALPTDYPRPHIQGVQGRVHKIELGPEMRSDLKEICRKEKATLFILLLACFNVLIYRYSGEKDVVVGIPVSGRNRYELEPLIGYFINTLVIRSDLSGDPTFREFLRRTSGVILDAYEHQSAPFDKLVEVLNPRRDPGYYPLFQIFFGFHNRQYQSVINNSLEISPVSAERKTSRFDMSFEIEEHEDNIWLYIEYRTDLYDASTIEGIGTHYKNIVSSVIGNPNEPISKIKMLSNDEINTIIHDWNGNETPYPDVCVHELFERQAALHPDSSAITDSKKRITYVELDNQAKRIANCILETGVAIEDCIAICMRPGIELVSVILGIFKAGCCYVPIDPDAPANRMTAIIKNSRAKLIIAHRELQSELPDIEGIRTWSAEEIIDKLPTDSPRASHVVPSNLAYIMYTSGSTGEPKGVEVTHGSIANFLLSMKNSPGINETDRLLSVTNFTFDISVLEMFLPLVAGAEVIFIERSDCRDGMKLKEKIDLLKPTIMQATPATWKMLINASWTGDKRGLKILCGGEVLESQLAQELILRGKEVWNLYGPTETTIWSTVYNITGKETEIPLGRPINNTKVYILDNDLNLLPAGIVGEIYISGAGVARGYRNNPGETEKRFIQDKLDEKQRMYRTGDRGKLNKEGLIFYYGRQDYQIKVRGYRIEAGEIEVKIQNFDGVNSCLVTSYFDSNGAAQLVAYLECKPDKKVDTAKLRDYLRTELPEYMVPTFFILLDKFPLTTNGKVDRNRLPPPSVKDSQDIFEIKKPKNIMEEKLVDIWESTLKVHPIGTNYNFFAIGGNSLTGTLIISRIKSEFLVDIPLKTIFEKPTISQIGEEIVMLQLKQLGSEEIDNLLNAEDLS